MCDLLKFKPKNGIAALALTAGIWTVLVAAFYLPLLVLYRQFGNIGEIAGFEFSDRKLLSYASIALPMLGGVAALASAYYNSKSRRLRHY